MTVLETDRLLLSPLSYDDCEFIFELVNEPSFKRFVGDKKVASADDARRYLRDGPIDNYERYGYGLYLVTLKDSGERVGICGLLRRQQFEDPDLGFAFLERFHNSGYASESTKAVLAWAFDTLKFSRVIAIADRQNAPSVRILDKLGFAYIEDVRMRGDEHDIGLYSTTRVIHAR